LKNKQRERAAAVKLHKKAPSNNPQNNPMTSKSTDVSKIDSWHEAQLADPNNNKEFCYGLGSNLYDKISAFPEIDSGYKCFEQFLTHLESVVIRMLSSLQQKDTCSISPQDRILTEKQQALADDPEWSLVQSDKTGLWVPMRITDYIANIKVHINRCWEKYA
jgi:hypothetical protein